MKILFQSVSESIISALGWTLVHSLWQGTVLAVIAFAGFYLLRKKSASLRYNLGIVLLALQVVISVATFSYYKLTTTIVKQSSSQLMRSSYIPTQVNWEHVTYQLSLTAKTKIWLSIHLHELVICWLIGAVMLMLRFAGGWIYTERLRSRARIVMDKQWRARFGILTAKLNITQSVEFRETTKILTPMVIGALQPVVLIPVGLLTGFSIAQVEAILAHELAHIRRNDYLVNMIQSLTEVFFFFHPALWYISERVRTEREHCCDDIAVGISGDRVSLAHALVKVAEWQSAPALAMAFASKKPLLLQRVRRVLGLTPKPVRSFAMLPMMLIAVGLVIGVSVYAVGQNDKKPAKKSTKARSATIRKRSKKSPYVYSDTIIVNTPDQTLEPEEMEVEAIEPVEIDENVNVNLNFALDSTFAHINTMSIGEGTISVNGFKNFFGVSSEENDEIRLQIQTLELQLEKYRFDSERAERQMEKLEWKKESAMEARRELMDKRREILSPSQGDQTKKSDIDAQLNDFEQQIKVQEEEISKINVEISKSRADAFAANEPARKIEKEIEELERKMNAPFAATLREKELRGYRKGATTIERSYSKTPRAKSYYYNKRPAIAPVPPKAPLKAPPAPTPAPPPPARK